MKQCEDKMGEFISLDKSHIETLQQQIADPGRLLFAQGLDFSGPHPKLREGYAYYALVNEAGQWRALLAFSPNRRLYLYAEDADLFRKVDFLRAFNRHMPLTVKAERESAHHLQRWLQQMKRDYQVSESFLMLGPPKKVIQAQKYPLPAGFVPLTADNLSPMVMHFVGEAERALLEHTHPGVGLTEHLEARLKNGHYVLIGRSPTARLAWHKEENRFTLVTAETETAALAIENPEKATQAEAVAQGAIDIEGGHYIVLGGIYVHPAYRRLGLGHYVLSALLRRGAERSKRAYLLVDQQSVPAIRLYEGHGFQTLRSYQTLYLQP